ncbi:acylphosphatase [Roseovarius salinarum]|uniref:acylphosphatase n=1 Tax=Roseovarius salinarum TaxID=1981892 RepID=UPI000C34555B|nr:acylphosphatase [Roseovarius salinarum]
MSEQTSAVHARVTGQVQGVSFRAWTQATAEGLGLGGWVRNTDDGAVEAVFRGPSDRVQQMTDLLYEGPAAAAVTQVELDPVEAVDEAPGFEIRL